jgi:hypothetical protein
MQILFDIVDLLQLQELWSRRPIITAFTRLERRQAMLPCPLDFNVDGLIPRLARLKGSAAWRHKKGNLTNDPARLAMRDLSEDYLNEMYPEVPSAPEARQSLFTSAYNHFIFAQYRAEADATSQMLSALAAVRQIDEAHCLDSQAFPRHGSSDWIPFDITDEIRGLDSRYRLSEPGTPAAYVIADDFWSLLVKASPGDVDAAINLRCPPDDTPAQASWRHDLTAMIEVAIAWNRSPSVVGLCYQTA